jgi:hypothetical protein
VIGQQRSLALGVPYGQPGVGLDGPDVLDQLATLGQQLQQAVVQIVDAGA